jgi:hypothetical protein
VTDDKTLFGRLFGDLRDKKQLCHLQKINRPFILSSFSIKWTGWIYLSTGFASEGSWL